MTDYDVVPKLNFLNGFLPSVDPTALVSAVFGIGSGLQALAFIQFGSMADVGHSRYIMLVVVPRCRSWDVCCIASATSR